MTDRHDALLAEIRDRWAAAALATAPLAADDVTITMTALADLYREHARSRSLPVVVVVPSPLVATVVTGCAATAAWAATASEVPTLHTLRSAVRLAALICFGDHVFAEPVAWWIGWPDRGVVVRRTASHVVDLVVEAVEEMLPSWPHRPWRPWLRESAEALALRMIGAMKVAWRIGHPGPSWAGWYAVHEAYRLVYRRDPPGNETSWEQWMPYERVGRHGGPFWAHDAFAVVADRPSVLHASWQRTGRALGDPMRVRLHCSDGPAVTYRDGLQVFYVNNLCVGMRMGALSCGNIDWLVDPSAFTPARILAEANIEVRRAMIDVYGVAAFVRDLGVRPYHEDAFGALYVVERPRDEPLLMVRVTDRTPIGLSDAEREEWLLDDAVRERHERTPRREFWLRVHPELRPLLDPERGIFGEPQAWTARNAVASTRGMRGDEYAPYLAT